MKKYEEKSNPNFIISVEKVDEDTTISTQWGDAVITAGNYVAQAEGEDGKFGIAADELESRFKPHKATKKS
jgi:hypothetical protein